MNSLHLGMGAVLVTALFLANLPFISNRLLGLIKRADKGLGLRFLELLIGYSLTVIVGLTIEAAIGERYTQGWQFYAVTACVFLVMTYPGFVYRYLWRKQADRPGEP